MHDGHFFPLQQLCLTLLLAVLGVQPAHAGCSQAQTSRDALTVLEGPQAAIIVCPEVVVREQLPPTLFGFNVNHYYFERDIWNSQSKSAAPKVAAALSVFNGGLYRYPGGLIANRFAWEAALGNLAGRQALKSVKWDDPAPVVFGVDEYLNFVEGVGGQPWFVLNLAGWDETELYPELDADIMADSNGRLAAHVLQRLGTAEPRYYQLGNELDRAQYQWSHAKYVDRARRTISAMHAADPGARFVAFLREFDWNYRGSEKSRGTSRYQDFIRDVLTGLPDVNDFSMHFYYDARDTTEKYRRLPWRLRQFRFAIDEAKKYRPDDELDVWITEHARGIDFGQMKAREARPYTSNLAAAVSTGDFLIALAQIPEIQGASWHGLNAMPWELFKANRDLEPSAVYWGLRVLREMQLPRVIGTWTVSPNRGGYQGGYDIRAVAFSDAAAGQLGVWAANRHNQPTRVELVVEEWSGVTVDVRHLSVAGRAGADPDAPDSAGQLELDRPPVTQEFSAAGRLTLTLPPASLSTIILTPQR